MSGGAPAPAAGAHVADIAGTRWNPGLYLRFADHRQRPALDLLDRVPLAAPRIAWDLGCGTGAVARLMAGRWPEASVHGLDHSREMLAKASAEPSRVAWVEADLRDWVPDAPPDLLYSNATLQWVDGHRDLFPRLAGLVAPGGCLAVQMPCNFDAPSHRLMRDVLAVGGPGGAPLGDAALRDAVAARWVESGPWYYDLLAPRCASIDVWETEYLHVLEGDDPVLEWTRATGLRPILAGLADAERDRFVSGYRERLREAYPRRADGRTLFPFRRLFIVATVR